MRLSVYSTSSLAAAVFVTRAAAVSAIDTSYEAQVQAQPADVTQGATLGEECSFVKSPQLRGGADAGILECAEPEQMCVEDKYSSLGGRCALIASSRRGLQTSNTPACISKCTGVDACSGLSASFIADNIADGSCCGFRACKGISGTTSIGPGSCLGNKACYYMKDATIGKGSCTGDSIQGDPKYSLFGFSCAYLQGSVGDSSCFEYAACYQGEVDYKTFDIGDNSCRGRASCSYTGDYSIDDNSCNEYYACYSSYGDIGKGSCNNSVACENNLASIGDYVCNKSAECQDNAAPLPPATSSPTKKPSLAPTSNAPTTALNSPTKKPVPTTSPTKMPTVAPTSAAPSKPPSARPTMPTVQTRKPSKSKSGKTGGSSSKSNKSTKKANTVAIAWFEETGGAPLDTAKPTSRIYIAEEPAGAPLDTAKPTSRIYIANKPASSPSRSNKPTRRQYLTNKPVSSFFQLTHENSFSEEEQEFTFDNFFVVADNDEPVRV